jgi:hypothetical protein
MSLAVLVDQTVQWQGKSKVMVPPSAETLKTIHDLVAGVTGLDADRGDQLVVETLPFESSVNAQPPDAQSPLGPSVPVKEPPFPTVFEQVPGPVDSRRGRFRSAAGPGRVHHARTVEEEEAPGCGTPARVGSRFFRHRQDWSRQWKSAGSRRRPSREHDYG